MLCGETPHVCCCKHAIKRVLLTEAGRFTEHRPCCQSRNSALKVPVLPATLLCRVGGEMAVFSDALLVEPFSRELTKRLNLFL